MTKKENNYIHVINFKNETIKPMDNFELSMWLNEFSGNKNNDLNKKKYLFAPDAKAAMYILTGGESA